jgi:hypothetical protein
MRTADEVRRAVRTLERVAAEMPQSSSRDVLMGEITSLKWLLRAEEISPTLQEILEKWQAIHAEVDIAFAFDS